MPRRKKKICHKTVAVDDKKLQSELKKISNPFHGVEEVNMFKKDGTVIHFENPKVQSGSGFVAISGASETKELSEMLPGIMNQLVCNYRCVFIYTSYSFILLLAL